MTLTADAAAFAACTSPFTPGADLADGAYTFRVRAADAAANVDQTPASRTVTIDTTAPDTSITDGPGDGSSTTDTTPTFTFDSPDAGATFECSVDQGTAAFAACTGPGKTHTPASALALGAYTFRVRAVDAATSADATPATRAFTVIAAAAAAAEPRPRPRRPRRRRRRRPRPRRPRRRRPHRRPRRPRRPRRAAAARPRRSSAPVARSPAPPAMT